jgi:hypothetical protein
VKPLTREVYKNGDASAGTELGDRSVFSHALYADGEEVGFDGGSCTIVRKEGDGRPYMLCNVSMSLPDGTLHYQTFMEEKFPPPPFHTAITGGTGAYAGARGEMYVDPASPDTHYYTVHLEGVDD